MSQEDNALLSFAVKMYVCGPSQFKDIAMDVMTDILDRNKNNEKPNPFIGGV